MADVLAVSDLSVSLSGTPIVRDVSFRLAEGELACILGPNGCGKTTTLRALLGLIPHDTGEISVLGRSLSGMNEKERAKLFAYVPQAREQPFSYTVRGVVELGRTPYLGWLSELSADDRAAVASAIARMGLSGLEERPFDRLSGGQQQLVLIARALAQDPSILVMDEPCASLDFGNQQLVLRQTRKLADEGMAVLMVTHDPNHVLGYADHAIAMQQGHILADGRPEEVLTDNLFQKLYDESLHVADVSWEGATKRVCIPWS